MHTNIFQYGLFLSWDSDMESGCVSPTWKLVVSETSSPSSQRASLCPINLPQWSCLPPIPPNSSLPFSISLPCFFIRILPYLTPQIISPIPESSFSPPSPERCSYFWCPLLTSALEPDSPLSTLISTVPLHWGVFGHLHLSLADAVNCVLFFKALPPQLCGSKLLLRLCFPLLIYIRTHGDWAWYVTVLLKEESSEMWRRDTQKLFSFIEVTEWG